MNRRNWTFFAAILACASAGWAYAADPKPPVVDRIRGYLIYEDSGELSKNIADREDQIVANDEKGTSVQMIMDVVLAAPANTLYEQQQPILHVVARSQMDDAAAKPIVDAEFPITFFAKGELVRTVVIDHNCNGVDLEAYVVVGDERVSDLKKTISITCGD